MAQVEVNYCQPSASHPVDYLLKASRSLPLAKALQQITVLLLFFLSFEPLK